MPADKFKFDIEKYVLQNLKRSVDTGLSAVAKMSEKASKSCMAAANELSWANGPAEQVAYGALCEQVLAYLEQRNTTSLRDAVAAVAEEQQRYLINDYYRGGSSSAFSNAMQAASRAAASNFVRNAQGWAKEWADTK